MHSVEDRGGRTLKDLNRRDSDVENDVGGGIGGGL
jgi:hypothetical protein